MKHAFYYDKKTGQLACYSSEAKNIVNEDIFGCEVIDLMVAEETKLQKPIDINRILIKDKKIIFEAKSII